MNDRSGKLFFLIRVARVAEVLALRLQQPLIRAGMRVMAFPAYALRILKVLDRLFKYLLLLLMAIRAKGGIAALQDQYLQETVTLVTLLTILVLEGLMDHLVAELCAHGLVAIDTFLAQLPPWRCAE